MSNGIQNRQNEESSITRLAAQRQLYNDVGVLDRIDLCFSVVVPFILAIVQVIFPSVNWVVNTSYILAIAMLFLTLFFDKAVRNKKILASSIQQDFDVYVFQMPWDEARFGKRKNLIQEIAEKSKKLMSKPSERERLTNWYRPEVDPLPLEKGIFACQRENYNWDGGLRKRYRAFALVLVILLGADVIAIGLTQNESVQKLLSRIVFILPMLKWLLKLWSDLGKDIERLEELESEMNNTAEKAMIDLQIIQQGIFEHRKNSVKVPNLIYNLFKDNDEDREHRIIQIDTH